MQELKNIKKVLIIKCGALGDLINATPILDVLVKTFGKDLEISWVATPGSAKIFEYDPRITHVFSLKHRKFPIWLSSEKKAIVTESFDLVINLEFGKQFFDIMKKVHASYKLGAPFTHIEPSSTPINIVDILKKIYEPYFNPKIVQQAYPKLFSASFDALKKKFKLPNKYLILAPSNSHHKKYNHRAWPMKNWQEVIQHYSNNIPLVIIGAKGEEAYFEPLLPYMDRCINLVGKTNMSELVSLIENTALLLTTDTGTCHIGAATNTQLITLIGPTDARITGPYPTPNNHVHLIDKHITCSPCHSSQRQKECFDNRCMQAISSQEVINTINKILNEDTE